MRAEDRNYGNHTSLKATVKKKKKQVFQIMCDHSCISDIRGVC